MEQETEEQPQMSEDEVAERLASLVATAPTAEDKSNVHTFLHNVAVSKDTTKTGNLEKEELGMPILPVRTYKELALFCSEVANMNYFSDYFNKKAEIALSTSLSKNAKLLDVAISQKREVADTTPRPMKENKGWFKKKTTHTNQYGAPTV